MFLGERIDIRAGKLLEQAAPDQIALAAVKPGGIFLTCSCTGLVSEEQFLDMLRRAAFYANRKVQVLKISGAGPDHPFLANVPESRYLKAAFCRVE